LSWIETGLIGFIQVSKLWGLTFSLMDNKTFCQSSFMNVARRIDDSKDFWLEGQNKVKTVQLYEGFPIPQFLNSDFHLCG
jgi:hypothetical protein